MHSTQRLARDYGCKPTLRSGKKCLIKWPALRIKWGKLLIKWLKMLIFQIKFKDSLTNGSNQPKLG